MEVRRTLCNRDCPDTCSILAHVDNGRITRLQGDPDHPVTRGFLCYRTNQFLQRQYAPDRLTQPLLRRHGALTPVSWDVALDHIAVNLVRFRAESGAASIFHYRSGGTLGVVSAQASDLFFEQFGPVTIKHGDICSGAGEAAQSADFGVADSNALHDLINARHILIWGKNVHTSSPHCLPILKQAQANGSELVLIDPISHRGRQLCDSYIQPRPAADLALALAVARALFDRGAIDPAAATYCDNLDALHRLSERHTVSEWCALADVTVEQALDLAERLASDEPCTILIGWGMARRLHGGTIVRAIDALAAISGNIGKPGAGASYYYQRKRGFRSLKQGLSARTICEPMFGPEVLAADPPIRGLWITAGNPVAMLPQSNAVAAAVRSCEMVVVVDSWMSDTVAMADVVLPTTTLLEADDLLGSYGHHTIGVAEPVVAPPVGVRSDLQIFQALAQRLDLTDYPQEPASVWKQRLLKPELQEHGIDIQSLRRASQRNPLAPNIAFEGQRFATANGRAQLLTDTEAQSAVAALDAGISAADTDAHDYPLLLLSLSTPKSQSSQWAKAAPKPTILTVHPDAAAGLAHGDIATLESAIGSVQVRIAHDPQQRRDVALMPKGGHLRDGSCANALIRAQTTDLGDGGALYDERVRLRPPR